MRDWPIDFDELQRSLAQMQPQTEQLCDRRAASVALIVQAAPLGLELLFIERARHPGDPWSGNLGFPGGRRDPGDIDLRHTAERETREEIGIDLCQARYLGRLADIVGQNLPIRVSCFVYGLQQQVEPQRSTEVQDVFWYRLEELFAPQRQVLSRVEFGGRVLEAPAVDLGLADKPVLWGITYRLVSQFRQLVCPDAGPDRSTGLSI